MKTIIYVIAILNFPYHEYLGGYTIEITSQNKNYTKPPIKAVNIAPHNKVLFKTLKVIFIFLCFLSQFKDIIK